MVHSELEKLNFKVKWSQHFLVGRVFQGLNRAETNDLTAKQVLKIGRLLLQPLGLVRT